jgi:hypothetical protein
MEYAIPLVLAWVLNHRHKKGASVYRINVVLEFACDNDKLNNSAINIGDKVLHNKFQGQEVLVLDSPQVQLLLVQISIIQMLCYFKPPAYNLCTHALKGATRSALFPLRMLR